LKELYTDILGQQMGRAIASDLEGHVLNFGSEIGYYDWNIRGFIHEILSIFTMLFYCYENFTVPLHYIIIPLFVILN
jgi:hypothetical protein